MEELERSRDRLVTLADLDTHTHTQISVKDIKNIIPEILFSTAS